MLVQAEVLRDGRFTNWHREVAGRWTIEDLRTDDGYRRDWISFDCMSWDEEAQLLYLGLTAIDTDIFWTFEPASRRFRSLEFTRVSDRYDAKFHRSLERDVDGTYVVATAMLHDMDQQRCAPGGKLVRYAPAEDTYEVLGVPVASQYIQSILLDRERRAVYGFTYPAEYMFVHDIDTGSSTTIAYVGNARMICQPHCAVMDGAGRIWGTWGESRAFEDDRGGTPIRFFSYDPARDEFEWFRHGPPKTWRDDPGNVDHMLLGKDGLIYVGTVSGGLSRLDPTDGSVTPLGRPFSGNRLAGLVQGRDGNLYGAGNEGVDATGSGTARMFRYEPLNGTITDLGRIFDADLDDGAVKIHALVEAQDGVFFAGENDNLYRSSYLWRCEVQ
jgi:hypothetical protein